MRLDEVVVDEVTDPHAHYSEHSTMLPRDLHTCTCIHIYASYLSQKKTINELSSHISDHGGQTLSILKYYN